METPKELCARLETDVSNILEMYDVAEKAYGYENVHGQRMLSENQQRF